MPSPTSWSSASNISLTGSQNIDALLSGTRWANSNITYSFPGIGAAWSTDAATGYGAKTSKTEPWSISYAPLTAAQQYYFSLALEQWANVANVHFTQVPDTSSNVGDIRAAFSYMSIFPNVQAWSTTPGNTAVAGDVWFNSISSSNADGSTWTAGGVPFFTALHEIGHTLGFKHPFNESGATDVALPTSLETRQYTVMSYTNQPNDLFRTITHNSNGSLSLQTYHVNPETPMVLDVAAIQYLYGANTGYNSGNNIYTFDPASPFYKTIWDAGGNDTISVGNFSQDCVIDLTPGNYSSIKILSEALPAGFTLTGGTAPTYDGSNNLGIAYGAIIENAVGGSGNDTLIGNNASNILYGGAGNDKLIGGKGEAHIFGGSGNNTLVSGAGQDVLEGGSGANVFVFQNASDSTPLAFDRILDFKPGQDKIDLSGIDANTTLAERQSFTFVNAANFSHTAGELRYSGWLLSGDLNGDGIAEFLVKMVGIEILSQQDIVL